MLDHTELNHAPLSSNHQSDHILLLFFESQSTHAPKFILNLLLIDSIINSPLTSSTSQSLWQASPPAGKASNESVVVSAAGASGPRGDLPPLRRRRWRGRGRRWRVEAAAEQPRDGGDEVVLRRGAPRGAAARERNVPVERLRRGDGAFPAPARRISSPTASAQRPHTHRPMYSSRTAAMYRGVHSSVKPQHSHLAASTSMSTTTTTATPPLSLPLLLPDGVGGDGGGARRRVALSLLAPDGGYGCGCGGDDGVGGG